MTVKLKGKILTKQARKETRVKGVREGGKE